MQPRSRYRKLRIGGCSVAAGAEFPAQGWVHSGCLLYTRGL